MALPDASLQVLKFTPYGQSVEDFVAVVGIDLSNYTSITIAPIGMVPRATNTQENADGVVIDNMLNGADITVQIGLIKTLVPRFQKTAIPLPKGAPNLVFTGSVVGSITPTAYFYVGQFRGVPSDLNAYASNQAANVASITGGTVDAYLNTIRWQANYRLDNGYNVDNINDSGFFEVLNPVNSGAFQLPAGTWQIQCFTYSASDLYQRQTAANMIDPTQLVYDRSNVQGAWTAWVPRYTDSLRPVAQTFAATQRLQIRKNIGALGTGYTYITAAASLTPASAGAGFFIDNNAVVTLPTLSQMGEGEFIVFNGYGLGGTIQAVAADGSNIFITRNPGLANFKLRPGQSAIVYASPLNAQWLVFSYATPQGDAPSVNEAQTFTAAQQLQARNNIGAGIPAIIGTLYGASSGYQRLYDGWIWQWGVTSIANDSYVTFPVAFPNACRFFVAVVVSQYPGANTTYTVSNDSPTTTQVGCHTRSVSGGAVNPATININWLAGGL